MSIDSDFNKNRLIYLCYNSKSGSDVRIVQYKINESLTSISGEKSIVDGLPAASGGRHSGCRIRTAKDGTIFIGTGDAAKASTPQSRNLLGGKILRVDRNGKSIPGNLTAPFDDRILSYGHRNVQGITLFDEPIDGVFGFSAEHGPDRDDEVNLIKAGNYGWAPTGDYNENVPMTDLDKFPDAIPAFWSSGKPTIATSGLTLISGEKWGSYNGALAVAALKGEQVKIIGFRNDYSIAFEESILTEFGRIRVVVQGPDNNLYLAIDDKENGKIIKVTPKGLEP
jgi:glucose/arabinose dehydrogenase